MINGHLILQALDDFLSLVGQAVELSRSEIHAFMVTLP
jgi:hypothetical protein